MYDRIALDPEALSVLSRLGGPAFPRQMIETFLRAAPKRLEQARAALRTGNWIELERFALALRASAGNVGALRIRDLAKALEAEAFRHNGLAVPPLLVRIETALARTRAAATALDPPAAAG
jgi:HPt (histidine-containing phosphotransfer) domain-containing protein